MKEKKREVEVTEREKRYALNVFHPDELGIWPTGTQRVIVERMAFNEEIDDAFVPVMFYGRAVIDDEEYKFKMQGYVDRDALKGRATIFETIVQGVEFFDEPEIHGYKGDENEEDKN